MAKATVEALQAATPTSTPTYTDEGHWLRQPINLGMAVAVEDGLVVPVIHDADRLSIHGLNREMRDLADRSRGNKLTLDDIQGGTFTLDNTGWTGSIITQPIINAPEVGILTMESIVKRPGRRGDRQQATCIGIDPMMYMTPRASTIAPPTAPRPASSWPRSSAGWRPSTRRPPSGSR